MPAKEQPFKQMQHGQAPSMIDADVANEVIDHCAAISSLEIIPSGSGTLTVSGRKAVLDLSTFITTAAGNNSMVFRVSIAGVATDVQITEAIVV